MRIPVDSSGSSKSAIALRCCVGWTWLVYYAVVQCSASRRVGRVDNDGGECLRRVHPDEVVTKEIAGTRRAVEEEEDVDVEGSGEKGRRETKRDDFRQRFHARGRYRV